MRFSTISLYALAVASSTSTIAAFRPIATNKNSRSSLSSASTTSLNMANNPSESVFLTPEIAKSCIDAAGGTPLYAYSLQTLSDQADKCLNFPNAYGLTVRYAMKASPNSTILKFFDSKGIHIDASSGYEVRRAIQAGIPPEHISLSTQELPEDFVELVNLGIKVNAW